MCVGCAKLVFANDLKQIHRFQRNTNLSSGFWRILLHNHKNIIVKRCMTYFANNSNSNSSDKNKIEKKIRHWKPSNAIKLTESTVLNYDNAMSLKKKTKFVLDTIVRSLRRKCNNNSKLPLN